jgi:uncharacterized protein YeaO (DUF488 family)
VKAASVSKKAHARGRSRIETRRAPVMLVFSAKEMRYNNAVALKEFIETEISSKV